MKLRFITFGYDYYWNQFVCGVAVYDTRIKGIVKWKRLFGIFKPLHRVESALPYDYELSMEANAFAEAEYITDSYEKERIAFGYYHGAKKYKEKK